MSSMFPEDVMGMSEEPTQPVIEASPPLEASDYPPSPAYSDALSDDQYLESPDTSTIVEAPDVVSIDDATPSPFQASEPGSVPAQPKAVKTKSARKPGPRKPRPSKEMFSVCVDAGDDSAAAAWFNITEDVGRKMRFTKPLFTCAMRVMPDEIIFSLLQITNKMRSEVVAAPVQIPRGPMGALSRTKDKLGNEGVLPVGSELLVIVDDYRATYTIERDEYNLVTLSGAGEQQDELELPRGATRAQIFLNSPGVGRLIGVFAIVYPGRAGTPTTLARIASEVLNAMSGLPEFRILSQIHGARVPAAPRRSTPVVPSGTHRASTLMQVRLFAPDEAPALVGHGQVVVEIDFERADASGGNILFSITAADPLTDEILEPFRAKLVEGLNWHLRSGLGQDDLTQISYEIVLGEVGHGTVQRLQETLATLPGLDLTPRRYLPITPPTS